MLLFLLPVELLNEGKMQDEWKEGSGGGGCGLTHVYFCLLLYVLYVTLYVNFVNWTEKLALRYHLAYNRVLPA